MVGWLFLLSTLLFFVAPSKKTKDFIARNKSCYETLQTDSKKRHMAGEERLYVGPQRPLLDRIKHASLESTPNLHIPLKTTGSEALLLFSLKVILITSNL